MTTNTINTSGKGRKRKAFSLLAARREVLIRRARRALLTVLLRKDEATVDDVRALVPLPNDVNPKVFGPVPSELAEGGIIIAAGYFKSTRPEAHARPLTLWRLADREGALRWLALHPDLPDVVTQDQYNNSFLFN